MPESEAEKARREAYERGRVDASINAQFQAHELHFAQINLSLERQGGKLDELSDRLRELEKREEGRDAVAAATKVAVEKQVSTRAFVFGVCGVIGTIIGLYFSANPPGG